MTKRNKTDMIKNERKLPKTFIKLNKETKLRLDLD